MCSTPRISFGGGNSPFERDHALGDVLGEIADALEVVGDAQRADDLAQIDRHRLAARDGQHGLLLDLALQRVDRARRRAMTRCASVGVAVGERVDRIGDLLFGKPAHLGDHAREILQIGVEGLDGVSDRCHRRSSLRRSSRSGR